MNNGPAFTIFLLPLPGTFQSIEVKDKPRGIFQSPNHPNDYDNDEYFKWIIPAPDSCTVKIYFNSFDMELDKDNVTILDNLKFNR